MEFTMDNTRVTEIAEGDWIQVWSEKAGTFSWVKVASITELVSGDLVFNDLFQFPPRSKIFVRVET